MPTLNSSKLNLPSLSVSNRLKIALRLGNSGRFARMPWRERCPSPASGRPKNCPGPGRPSGRVSGRFAGRRFLNASFNSFGVSFLSPFLSALISICFIRSGIPAGISSAVTMPSLFASRRLNITSGFGPEGPFPARPSGRRSVRPSGRLFGSPSGRRFLNACNNSTSVTCLSPFLSALINICFIRSDISAGSSSAVMTPSLFASRRLNNDSGFGR